MRGRDIHKIAHWSMMFLLLMFPLLMVGISTFGKESQTIDVTETYEYETNEVNSVDDLVVGNIYKLNIDTDYLQTLNPNGLINVSKLYNYMYVYGNNTDYTMFVDIVADNQLFTIYKGGNNTSSELNIVIKTYNVSSQTFNWYTIYDKHINYDCYFVFYETTPYTNLLLNYISASDYLGEKTVDYVINNEDYKQDVNNWINGFLNLPINAWYKSLMNVIGVGFTTSTVMNVIYVMPVYIIWVFVLDLIVDCLLVIVRIPHKALNRLGGDNE